MEIAIDCPSFIRRLFFSTRFYILLLVFLGLGGLNYFFNNIGSVLKLIYILVSVLIVNIILDIIETRKYLYKISCQDNCLFLFYKYYNTDRKLVLELTNFDIKIKVNQFRLSKSISYVLNIYSISDGKKKIQLRQYQIAKWDEALMKSVKNSILIEMDKKITN